MQIGARHWALALFGAVLVHAGVAVAILWQPPQSGAVSAGMGGVEVSLGPAGGAPGGEARPVEEVAEAETAEVPQIVPAETPLEETAVEPTETAPPDPVEPVATVPVEAARPVEVAEAAPAEKAVAIVEEPPVEETQADVPQPAAETTPPEEVTATTMVVPPPPPPKPRPPERPQPVAEPEPVREPSTRTAEAAQPAEDQVAGVEPSAAGAGGKAGTQANPDAGSADASSGGGMPGATADYLAMLQAWLEKHKEYPRRAQLRRQEGTALLYFVMDREGRVIEYRLQQSSGHDLLDREVAAMIERAQPLPKIPEEMDRARLELVVPVQFFLR